VPRGESPPRARLSSPGRVVAGLAIGLGVVLLLLLARRTRLVESLEARLVDVRTRHFADDLQPDPRIVVCQVEDGDVAALQEAAIDWPWPLDVNAAIVRTIGAAGADTLVVDVLHLDRGAGPDDRLHTSTNPAVIASQEGEAAAAAEYAKALSSFGRTAIAFEMTDEPRWQLPGRVHAAERPSFPLRVRHRLLTRRGADLPIRTVAEAAALLGFVNAPAEGDGVVRRMPTFGSWGRGLAMSLAYAGAFLAHSAPPRGAIAEGPRIGDFTLPSQTTDDDGRFFVSYRAGHVARRRAYRRVTPSQVFAWSQETQDGKVPDAARAALAGTVVVFGVNLAGQKDVVATPMGETFEGPEFQAAAIDDLLHGTGRVSADRGVNVMVLVAAALFVALFGTAPKRKWIGHAAAAATLVGVSAFAFREFRAGLVLDLVTPALAVVLAWGGALAARLLTEGRYNRWLEGTFSRYLAPSVIETLKHDPSLLALGGRRREVSLLFSDVAGFTKLSETLPPEDVVGLLNRYLTQHTAAVLEAYGVVDKFMGDGVMAFFGDPVPQPDHAVRACRAALAVQAGLPALEPEWRRLGLKAFPVRIGVESGDVVVGNMGSEQRLDYTCMGDVVNLASRLEGANKAFGTRILLGPGATARAKEHVVANVLGDVVVVGRAAPVTVAELVAMRDGASADVLAHAGAFAAAREALKAGRVDEALAGLAEAERRRPGSGAVAWLRGIADAMRSGEEPSPWSGLVRLESK
jgi:adenylate cyclase